MCISSLIFVYIRSYTAAIWSFIAGISIDLDHIIDYYINETVSIDIKKMIATYVTFKYKKPYVIFHSLEILLILWLMTLSKNCNAVLLGIALGATQHMIFDQVSNALSPFTYFFTFRLIKGFNKYRLFKYKGPNYAGRKV